MKKNKMEELVLEYLQGDLSPEHKDQLKKELQQLGFALDDLSDLEKMYADLGRIEIPQADIKMTSHFYEKLAAHKSRPTKNTGRLDSLLSWIKNIDRQMLILNTAYSVILLFAGWAAGFWLTPNTRYDIQLEYLASEIREMRTTVTISMLNQPSASERIMALNTIDNLGQQNEQVISVLLNTLNNDANVNVRLVALEVLVKYSDNNRVREGLIYSLGQQNSPLIQLALTGFFVSINEKEAVGPLKHLLHQKELNDVVRSRIEKSLKILI